MSSVLEPWSTSGDVVGGALALCLDEDGSVDDVLAVPWLEGLEQLETVGRGADRNVDGSSIGGGRLEGVLPSIVTFGGKLESLGLRELELLPIVALKGVLEGVEGEVTGKDHGGNDIG